MNIKLVCGHFEFIKVRTLPYYTLNEKTVVNNSVTELQCYTWFEAVQDMIGKTWTFNMWRTDRQLCLHERWTNIV